MAKQLNPTHPQQQQPLHRCIHCLRRGRSLVPVEGGYAHRRCHDWATTPAAEVIAMASKARIPRWALARALYEIPDQYERFKQRLVLSDRARIEDKIQRFRQRADERQAALLLKQELQQGVDWRRLRQLRGQYIVSEVAS